MKRKSRKDIERFLENQKAQLGLSDDEMTELLRESAPDLEDAAGEIEETVFSSPAIPAPGAPANLESSAAAPATPTPSSRRKKAPMKTRRTAMSDPYLPESRTIRARPTKISKFRSLFFEHALPNEFIVEIGAKDVKPVLGGKFFKLGKRFLKFPAAVQTVYFTSDNANKNYQGLKIDGYACWRVDPERPEAAAASLDFTDRENPMGNTNRILRTICTEAIRHIIANITIEEALTKKDEIGRDLKAQLERIERTWGILFDQVGIERVTILSSAVFDDLQQKTRDDLRLTASESRMRTDQEIEKKKAANSEELESFRCGTDKKSRILRATTESEIHKVELDERLSREAEERRAEEQRKKEESEAAERSAIREFEETKRRTIRDAEIEAQKNSEKHKLETAKAQSGTELEILRLEDEARIAEAQARSLLQSIESDHPRMAREQELQSEREFLAMKKEQHLKSSRLTEALKRADARFAQKCKEEKEAARLEHEGEVKRLERLAGEEELRNLVSENRILSEFVNKLPDIAASIKIDRYSVFDGRGDSPISHALSRIVHLLDAHGLMEVLSKAKGKSKDRKQELHDGKGAGDGNPP